MRVLFVASEVVPWCKTGGLADVAGALPRALRDADGVEAAVFLPLFPQAREHARAAGIELEPTDASARVHLSGRWEEGRFWAHRPAGGVPHFFLEHEGFYAREGIYGDRNDQPYPDNAFRFAFLCRAVLEAGAQLAGGPPDVVHVHDWQTGLLPVYMRSEGVWPRARVVYTIHNLAYQGVFPKQVFPGLGLDWSLFRSEQLEFYDQVNLLKGGVAFADAVTTVSPTYAEEIQTPERGEALDGFLRHHARRLHGILNGLDAAERTPPFTDLAEKAALRAALLEELGLPAGDEPLLGVVSRFAHQKGLDLVAGLVAELEVLGARLVVLGSGDPGLVATFQGFAAEYPERLAVRVGFDAALARRIVAGSDLFLVPSRFEPCGLTQQQAMAFGTPPVVHGVGGLRDTVREGETGFVFGAPTVEALRGAVVRAVALFREDPAGWERVQRQAMARDASWGASAEAYLELYRELVAEA